MVTIEPKSGDNSGFGVPTCRKVDNGLFDTLDTSLVKSK